MAAEPTTYHGQTALAQREEATWRGVGKVRRPTAHEASLFDRGDGGNDAVLRIAGITERAAKVIADALELAGYCDSAHALPRVGIYLEE
jgi:hypothetical protein